MIHIIILEDVFEDLPEDFETRFDNTNSEVSGPLPIRKNVNGLMKVELGGKIMKAIICLRTKMFNYLTNDRCVDKKAKRSV